MVPLVYMVVVPIFNLLVVSIFYLVVVSGLRVCDVVLVVVRVPCFLVVPFIVTPVR